MRSCYRHFVALCLAVPGWVFAGYSNMFVFGDSLSDSGNILLASPSLSFLPLKPVPGAPYFQGRASNGPVAVEVLAQHLQLSLTPSLAPSGGNNFAYGGARTDTHAFEVLAPVLFPGQSVDVDFDVLSQLSQFNAANVSVDPNALYVVFAGSNNLQDAIRAAGADPANATAIAQAAIANAVGDLATVIGTLSARGARNFLVPNAPNVALVPRVTEQNNPAVSQFAAQVTVGFNTALAGALASFQNPDLISFDLFGLLQQVVADPAALGLTNITGRCYTGDDLLFTGGGSVCADPSEFLFWDGIHPTASVHAVLGNALFAALPAAVDEPSVLALVGIAFWAGWRRRG